MKTKLYFLGLLCISAQAFTQTGGVGINTDTPSATLDINGNLKVRTTPTSSTLTNYTVLGVNTTSKEVTSLDASLFSASTATPNSSIFAARRNSGFTLLQLSVIGGQNFRTVQFQPADRQIGAVALLAADHSYVVPSAGVYRISFDFRYGTGLETLVLSGLPSVGIVRLRNAVYTLVDSKRFAGLDIGVASTVLSDVNLTSYQSLEANDKIYFGTYGSVSLLSASALTSSVSGFSIEKVSNPL